MPGKVDDIEKLNELQELDKNIDAAYAQIQNSPYAKKIEAARAKKSEYKTKRDQIDGIYKKARAEFEEITAKDSELAASQTETQKKIEETQGDYRKVESYTNKLNELTNNRKVIDEKLVKVEANYNKISELKGKIDEAIGKVSMLEDDLNKKLQEENATAQIEYNKNVEKKNVLVKSISEDSLKMYKHAREIAGNVAVAELLNNSCSVCRNNFSPVTLDKIKGQAPISSCPNCQRLLIVV
ncbi:MAG: hypothetical protein Q4E88_06115 [Coriobacteriia bacterium]|nr:hypothetical protein [Coriobacteriia bacterium]